MFINKISNFGVDVSLSDDENKKIRIINNSSLVGITVLFIHIIFNLANGTYLIALSDFVASQLFFLVTFFNWKAKYNTAQLVLFIVFPIGLLPFNLVLGNVGSENFLFTMIILAFYLLEKTRRRIFISAYYACTYIAIKLILHTRLSMELFPELESYFYWFNITVSFVSITLVSSVYSRENKAHLLLLKKQNKELNCQNSFINELLKELNHRVKNNLQIISGLFNLQRYNTDNKELINGLSDARNRVVSISLLHQKLYVNNTHTTKVLINGYLFDLCNFIIQASGLEDSTGIEIIADDIYLSIEDSVHVGLIVNEAITNSVKYAFNGGGQQKIMVELKVKNDFAYLKVSDNGKGFPDDFKTDDGKQFGLFLIRTIAENNDGEVEFYNNKGATVDVKLSVSHADI